MKTAVVKYQIGIEIGEITICGISDKADNNYIIRTAKEQVQRIKGYRPLPLTYYESWEILSVTKV